MNSLELYFARWLWDATDVISCRSFVKIRHFIRKSKLWWCWKFARQRTFLNVCTELVRTELSSDSFTSFMCVFDLDGQWYTKASSIRYAASRIASIYPDFFTGRPDLNWEMISWLRAQKVGVVWKLKWNKEPRPFNTHNATLQKKNDTFFDEYTHQLMQGSFKCQWVNWIFLNFYRTTVSSWERKDRTLTVSK